jgi:hypothetical protein
MSTDVSAEMMYVFSLPWNCILPFVLLKTCHFFQLETCLEIANVQLSQEDLDIMLQHIGLDDDGTVCEGMFVMNTLGIQRIQYNVASLLGISATV